MHPIINNSKSQFICWFVTDEFLHLCSSELVLRCQTERSSGTDSRICYSRWRKATVLVPVKKKGKKRDVFIMQLLFHPLLAPAVSSSPPRVFFYFFYNAVTVLAAINTVFITPCSTSRLQRWLVKGQSSLAKGREGGRESRWEGAAAQRCNKLFWAERAAFHYS